MKIITSFICVVIFSFIAFFNGSEMFQNRPEKALKEVAVQEGVLKEITDWDTRLEYARVLSNLKRYDESLLQYHKLLDEKPNAVVVRIEIARVLYYQGNNEEALELLENISSRDLDDKSLVLMGDIYLVLKDYQQAELIYQDQLRKFPQDDLTKFKLADLLSWQKRYEESVRLYRQLLVKKPDDVQLRRKYVMVLIWMGEDYEAALELEKTLK